jgi:hypothetical protein
MTDVLDQQCGASHSSVIAPSAAQGAAFLHLLEKTCWTLDSDDFRVPE